jgi:hypothetical protein
MSEQSCKHGILGGCDLCMRDAKIARLAADLTAALDAQKRATSFIKHREQLPLYIIRGKMILRTAHGSLDTPAR